MLAHPTAAAGLPVITSEIGDTWIYGSQSDPKKMKLARLMMRERSACTDCDFMEPAVTNFSRLLLKTTEHTFGLHGLGEQETWDNSALRSALTAARPGECNATGEQTPLFAPFMYKNDGFTKTGSGQQHKSLRRKH